MRIGRRVIGLALNCSVIALLTGMPCFGQAAKVFVKVEPHQCWLDVKDSVHRRALSIATDETQHTLTIERFASMGGDISIVVAVEADQNKKAEEGCSIIVAESGSASLSSPGARVNALNGSNNLRAAASIAGDVKAAQKARDKKAKNNNP